MQNKPGKRQTSVLSCVCLVALRWPRLMSLGKLCKEVYVYIKLFMSAAVAAPVWKVLHAILFPPISHTTYNLHVLHTYPLSTLTLFSYSFPPHIASSCLAVQCRTTLESSGHYLTLSSLASWALSLSSWSSSQSPLQWVGIPTPLKSRWVWLGGLHTHTYICTCIFFTCICTCIFFHVILEHIGILYM